MPVVDTVITARWVLPIEPGTDVPGIDMPSTELLEWHSVVVHQGRIVAVLPREVAAERYQAQAHIERRDHLLLPGLVNAHVDLGRVLLRDTHVLSTRELHDADADPEFVRTAVELAAADALLTGTTCIGAISFAPDRVAATASAAHLRACVGLPISAEASLWASDVGAYLQKNLALRDEYRNDPRIATFFVVPDAASVSDATLARIRRNADEIELPVALALDAACCDLSSLRSHGLLSPLLVARAKQPLTADSLSALGKQRASVLWPTRQSASELFKEPVNVAVGSAARGEYGQLDLLALLRRRLSDAPDAVEIAGALRAVTLGGAHALGLAEHIGSLTPGKWADLTCVDLARINTRPLFDPLAQFLLHSTRGAITDVWVAGEALVTSGVLTRLDVENICQRAQVQAAAFLDR